MQRSGALWGTNEESAGNDTRKVNDAVKMGDIIPHFLSCLSGRASGNYFY